MTLLPILALTLLQAPVQQPTAVTSDRPDPAHCLTVKEAGGLKRTTPGCGRLDLGPVDALATPRVEREFAIRNETATPLFISSVKGSCGCETLVLAKGGVPAAQTSLAPGEEASVRVAIDSHRLSGEFRKYVWVYGQGSARPLAAVELAGVAREVIRFAPRVLQFGQIAPGGTASLSLLVSVDVAAAPNGLPPLECASPGVEVVPDGAEKRAERDGKPAIERKYRVTVTPRANGGLLTGVIRFALPAERQSLLASASVAVMGNVRGGLTVTPAVALFGSVQAGKAVRRQVVLSAASMEQLKDLAATSTQPYVAVELGQPEAAGSSGSTFMRMLSITLKETMPAGPIQAQVSVSSPDGRRLTIPIVGEAVK